MRAVYLVFDFITDQLNDHAAIVALMGTFSATGWRFLKKAIVCDDVPGTLYVPDQPRYLAAAWQNAIRAAPRYGGGYWMEMENAGGFRLSFGFDPRQPRRLYLSFDADVIRTADGVPNVRAMVRVGEQIYAALRPHYGFGLFSYDSHEIDAPGASPAAVWDYNWFSPALAEQIGLGELLSAPAWRKEMMRDGGVLLELSPSPIAEMRQHAENYRGTAALLGWKRVHQGG